MSYSYYYRICFPGVLPIFLISNSDEEVINRSVRHLREMNIRVSKEDARVEKEDIYNPNPFSNCNNNPLEGW